MRPMRPNAALTQSRSLRVQEVVAAARTEWEPEGRSFCPAWADVAWLFATSREALLATVSVLRRKALDAAGLEMRLERCTLTAAPTVGTGGAVARRGPTCPACGPSSR